MMRKGINNGLLKVNHWALLRDKGCWDRPCFEDHFSVHTHYPPDFFPHTLVFKLLCSLVRQILSPDECDRDIQSLSAVIFILHLISTAGAEEGECRADIRVHVKKSG